MKLLLSIILGCVFLISGVLVTTPTFISNDYPYFKVQAKEYQDTNLLPVTLNISNLETAQDYFGALGNEYTSCIFTMPIVNSKGLRNFLNLQPPISSLLPIFLSDSCKFLSIDFPNYNDTSKVIPTLLNMNNFFLVGSPEIEKGSTYVGIRDMSGVEFKTTTPYTTIVTQLMTLKGVVMIPVTVSVGGEPFVNMLLVKRGVGAYFRSQHGLTQTQIFSRLGFSVISTTSKNALDRYFVR